MTAWMDKPDCEGDWRFEGPHGGVALTVETQPDGTLYDVESGMPVADMLNGKWRKLPSPAELDALDACAVASDKLHAWMIDNPRLVLDVDDGVWCPFVGALAALDAARGKKEGAT